jgi:CBS domain-containing protein
LLSNAVATGAALQLPECDALCLWLARFPIQNNLPRTLVFSSVRDDPVFVVHSDELLVSVFGRLNQEGFLGCPVVDIDNMYRNQVDILDILFYVCNLFKARQPTAATHPSTSADEDGVHSQYPCLTRWLTLTPRALSDFIECSEYEDTLDSFLVPSSPRRKMVWNDFFELDGFKATKVNHLLTSAAASWEGPKAVCQPSHPGCSSLGVLEQMARMGTHRVPVLSDAGGVLGLVTQSMFISLFSQQMPRLGRLKDLRVSDLINTLVAVPYVVKEESLAINAFKLMAKHNVAGLGVVDSEGYLVSAITVKDLNGIGCKAEYFERLWYPVRLFLQRTQSTTPQPLKTVNILDTLQTVIEKMDDGNVHLVFVVTQESGSKQKPLHVITQRDVLKVICIHMGMLVL